MPDVIEADINTINLNVNRQREAMMARNLRKAIVVNPDENENDDG